MKFLSLIVVALALSGCLYKMPTRRDFSTLPNINNPSNTREKPSAFLPGK